MPRDKFAEHQYLPPSIAKSTIPHHREENKLLAPPPPFFSPEKFHFLLPHIFIIFASAPGSVTKLYFDRVQTRLIILILR